MRRQGIAISLEDLKKIGKLIRKELKDIEKLGIVEKGKEKVRFQLNIVNYPTVYGNKTRYCSDTWEFEMLRKNENE